MGETRRARELEPACGRYGDTRDAAGGVHADISRRPPAMASSGGRALASITVHDVSRSFVIGDERLLALDRLGFSVGDREVVAIVGPNGSGKSTLLRLVAGLLLPDRGEIEIDARPVRGPDERVGLVFQEPRLLPWRSTRDNIGLPLELAGWPVARRRARVDELLTLVGLEAFAAALPRQLSGGMRQRAAIARALALGPGVLLLDEPFSALDALTRERLNRELLDVWTTTGTTILLVTHDIAEAVFMADRVLVLSARPGRLAAEVRVDVARPRSPAGMDAAAFSSAAADIRAHLEVSTGTDAREAA